MSEQTTEIPEAILRECEAALDAMGGWQEHHDLGAITEAVAPILTAPLREELEATEERLGDAEARIEALLTPLQDEGRSIESLPWDDLLGVAVRNLNEAMKQAARADSAERRLAEAREALGELANRLHDREKEAAVVATEERFRNGGNTEASGRQSAFASARQQVLDLLATLQDSQVGIRDQAVANVDHRHGYTVEFSDNPESHREEYDEEEARLAATLQDSQEDGEGEKPPTSNTAHMQPIAWRPGDASTSAPDEGLPPELLKALRDPTVTIAADREYRLANGQTLAEHLEEWRNAPSNTVGADSTSTPEEVKPLRRCLHCGTVLTEIPVAGFDNGTRTVPHDCAHSLCSCPTPEQPEEPTCGGSGRIERLGLRVPDLCPGCPDCSTQEAGGEEEWVAQLRGDVGIRVMELLERAALESAPPECQGHSEGDPEFCWLRGRDDTFAMVREEVDGYIHRAFEEFDWPERDSRLTKEQQKHVETARGLLAQARPDIVGAKGIAFTPLDGALMTVLDAIDQLNAAFGDDR